MRIGWSGAGNAINWRLGGSLITVSHILTAAHGVFGTPPTTIIAGSRYVFRNNHSEEQPEYRDVQRVFIHPNYESTSDHQQNDIAIVSVTKPFVIQLNIRPACLYNGIPETGKISIIIGYGQIQFGI